MEATRHKSNRCPATGLPSVTMPQLVPAGDMAKRNDVWAWDAARVSSDCKPGSLWSSQEPVDSHGSFTGDKEPEEVREDGCGHAPPTAGVEGAGRGCEPREWAAHREGAPSELRLTEMWASRWFCAPKEVTRKAPSRLKALRTILSQESVGGHPPGHPRTRTRTTEAGPALAGRGGRCPGFAGRAGGVRTPAHGFPVSEKPGGGTPQDSRGGAHAHIHAVTPAPAFTAAAFARPGADDSPRVPKGGRLGWPPDGVRGRGRRSHAAGRRGTATKSALRVRSGWATGVGRWGRGRGPRSCPPGVGCCVRWGR